VLIRMMITIALVAIAGINPALGNTIAAERNTPRALADPAYIAMGLDTYPSTEADQLRSLTIKGGYEAVGSGRV
jgi:hypothetical protein